MSGEEEGWCSGREDLREEIIAWLFENSSVHDHGMTVEVDELIAFLRRG